MPSVKLSPKNAIRVIAESDAFFSGVWTNVTFPLEGSIIFDAGAPNPTSVDAKRHRTPCKMNLNIALTSYFNEIGSADFIIMTSFCRDSGVTFRSITSPLTTRPSTVVL